MKRLALCMLVACGGSSKPAPKPAPEPKPTYTTRVPAPDDEQEDGVELTSSKGHVDEHAVTEGLEPHKADLSACYTSKVGKRRWLGGHVSLQWDIDKAGTVTKVLLAESDLGAWDVEKCLLDIARSASFGKPVGGDAEVALPLDFSAKGKSAVWDEDASLRAVGGQIQKLDECVKPPKNVKLKKPIAMPDDVTVTVYVGPAGAAQSVGFSSKVSEIEDLWAQCAEKQAMSWRLPDPKGQIAKLAVRYRPRS